MKMKLKTIIALLLASAMPFAYAEGHTIVTDSQLQKIKVSAVQFGYASHELVRLAENTELANKLSDTIHPVREQFESALFALKTALSSGNQIEAIQAFGNTVLGLAHKFHLRNFYFQPIAPALSASLSIDQQLAVIAQAINALEKYFISLAPGNQAHAKITDYFFYNYLTTKVIPKTIEVAAPFIAYIWALTIKNNYEKNVNPNTNEGAIGVYREKCTIPTEAKAFRGYKYRVLAAHKAALAWIEKSENQKIKNHRDEIKRKIAFNEAAMKDLMKADVPPYAWDGNVFTHKNDIPIGQGWNTTWINLGDLFLDEPGIEAKKLRKDFLTAARDTDEYATEYHQAKNHLCDFALNNRHLPANQRRGEDLHGGIDKFIPENPTQWRIAKNAGMLGKDVAWALRPLYLYFGLNWAAKKMHALQIEKYTRRRQDALDRMPIEQALQNTILIDPTAKKFSNYASNDQLEEYMLNDFIARIADPLMAPKHLLLCGSDSLQLETAARGIAKATSVPMITLGPLAAAKRANVQATIQKAVQTALARADKTVIIHLDDIDYLTNESKALKNIKEFIFDQTRNPYIKIVVIATAASAESIPAELCTDTMITETKLIQ